MKRHFSLLIATLTVIVASAQWKKLTTGTNRNLHDTYFINNNLGYAVGDSGTILNTTNGGANWTIQNSNLKLKLSSVFFTDSDNGYIVGDSALLLKTTNGGLNWNKQTLGIPAVVSLNSIYFTNDSSGYILSNAYENTSNSNILLKTTNKGINWTLDTFGVGVTSSLFFSSKDTGYLVGNSIRKTTNAGMDWQSESFNAVNLNGITHNTYDNNMIAVGASGKIVYGSKTATVLSVINSGTTENLNRIVFDSYYHYYFVVGDHGSILRNRDSDPITSWTKSNSGVTCNLNCISTMEQGNYSSIVVGDSGTILRSTDYGVTWTKINSSVTNNLYAFAGDHGTSGSGYIVGDNGIIFRLSSNGTSLTKVQNGLTTRKLNYICYNGSTYYIVGEKGTIIKAANSFTTITKQYVDSAIDLSYVHFYTANGNQTTYGFACGFDNARNESVILYTTNGGTNWNKSYTGFKSKLRGGADQDQYIAGENGTILFAPKETYPTSYNFKYWQHYNELTFDPSGSVFFTGNNIGFAANRSSNLFKTTDGGNNWNMINVSNIRSLFFTDTAIGYLAGSGGNLKKTTNSGMNWTAQTSSTTSDLNKLCFPSTHVGYAAGNNGTVIKIWSITVAANDSMICQGDTAILTASGDGTNYTWSNGASGSTIKVAPATTTIYTVTGTSADGSSDTKSITVTVNPKPNVTVTIDTPVIKPGHSATLCASGAVSYKWNTGQTTPCITVYPSTTTNYSVIGKNACGAADTEVAIVTVSTVFVADMTKVRSSILVYPIPAQDKIRIESSQNMQGELFVYDLNGKEFIKQEIDDSKIEVNIATLASGIYYIKLKTSDAIEVRKIIKE